MGEHIPCPECGSSDAGFTYEEGNAYCFKCNHKWWPDSVVEPASKKKRKTLGMVPLGQLQYGASSRGLTEETCKKYKIATTDDGSIIYTYCGEDGKPVAQKVRRPGKSFFIAGDPSEMRFFGQHMFRHGGRMVTVTEGEPDAASMSQLTDLKWPCVSVPNGAGGAKRCFEQNLEWLESFERVNILFDQDEEGRKAAKECAQVLSPGKAHIGVLPLKDANECLQKGMGPEAVDAMWSAKPYRPDGIVSGDTVLAMIQTPLPPAVPYPWSALTEITKGGMRLGELVTWTAGTGIGKSTVVREVAAHLVQLGHKVGYIALEESIRTSALAILSVMRNERLLLQYDPDIAEDWQKIHDRIIFYDHFGSLAIDHVLAKIRYMVKAMGCHWIILDHLSILSSGLESQNERKDLDVAMTKLRSFVQETQCGMHLVSHLSRPGDGGSHEEGSRVKLRHLRGSQAIPQLSDYVVALERDQQGDGEERNVSTVRVLKGGRLVGETGIAGQLRYDPETGRLVEHAPVLAAGEDY